MTDVPSYVGSNPACMLRHTSVTANVPALLRVRAHACVPQYARDNSDGSTLVVSTDCKRMERSVLSLRTVLAKISRLSQYPDNKKIINVSRFYAHVSLLLMQ